MFGYEWNKLIGHSIGDKVKQRIKMMDTLDHTRAGVPVLMWIVRGADYLRLGMETIWAL